MDVEQIKTVIESLSAHYEKHKEKHSFTKQSQAILERRSSAISISSSAAKISAIYEVIRKSGDTDAIQAFRDTMVDFSQNGKSSDFIHFIHTAEDLATESPNTLLSIFSTVSDIEKVSLKQNLSLDAVAWLSNLGYLTNEEINSYLDATKNILEFDTEYVESSFQRFVATTSDLAKHEKPNTDDIESYLTGVKEQKDDIHFTKYDREFRERVASGDK